MVGELCKVLWVKIIYSFLGWNIIYLVLLVCPHHIFQISTFIPHFLKPGICKFCQQKLCKYIFLSSQKWEKFSFIWICFKLSIWKCWLIISFQYLLRWYLLRLKVCDKTNDTIHNEQLTFSVFAFPI